MKLFKTGALCIRHFTGDTYHRRT